MYWSLTYHGKKWKMAFTATCISLQMFLTKLLQKCSFRGPLPNIHFLLKPLNLIGYHGNQKPKYVKKYSKINSSEAEQLEQNFTKPITAPTSQHVIIMNKTVCGISWNFTKLFLTLASTKILVFIAVAHALWLLWQSFHWLTMGTVKIVIYYYLIADTLTKVLQKCLLSGPPPSI